MSLLASVLGSPTLATLKKHFRATAHLLLDLQSTYYCTVLVLKASYIDHRSMVDIRVKGLSQVSDGSYR